MKQATILTKRVEGGLVELSVLYDPSETHARKLRDAGQSLLRTQTSLFVSVDSMETNNQQWRFFATMNPAGSQKVVLSNLALFRVWAERLTGAICCIDMEGFSEEQPVRPTTKKGIRSK